MAGLTTRSSGEEVRDALAAVLDDQAERKRRRGASPESRDWSRVARIAVGPLVVLAVWLVVAPPSLLRPPPPPAPTVEDIRTGLTMDIYVAAARVVAYREANGRLPDHLGDVLAEPEAAAGLDYARGDDGTFEIAGERAGEVVVYSSTEPLAGFAARARSVVAGGSEL